jgi:hypothetical protein
MKKERDHTATGIVAIPGGAFRKMCFRTLLPVLLAVFTCLGSDAQDEHGVREESPRFALKTNLLYGLGTLTPNMAAEIAVAPKWTIEAAYSYNPWNYRAKAANKPSRKLLHGIARLEGKYWFDERFTGHFAGVHALYSEYNISGYDIPLLFEKEYRYRGNAWGGGLVYGYDLPMGKSWNVEFTAGFGVYRMVYDRYSCLVCSEEFRPVKKTWVGPSRLGVSIEFLIE